MKPISNNSSHRIYFIRHGESIGNIKKVLLPFTEDELTETGWLQAKLLGKYLSNVTFTRVYSSPFPRARKTVECVMEHSHKSVRDLDVNFDWTLVERVHSKAMNFGTFEGKPYKEAVADAIQQNVHPLKWEPLGGETYSNFSRRTFKFFENLLQTLDESDIQETVMVVTHGSFMLTFLAELTRGGSLGDPYQVSGYNIDAARELIGNTEYFVLNVEKLELDDNATQNNVKRRVHFEVTKSQEHLTELTRTMPDLFPTDSNKSKVATAEIQHDFLEKLAKCV